MDTYKEYENQLENKNKQTRKKLFWIIMFVLIGILQIVLLVSAIVLPLSTDRAVSYTCKKVFFDLENIDVILSMFKEGNFRAEMSSSLNEEGKIKEGKGFVLSTDGKMTTLKTVFNSATGAILTIKYDDKNLYFGGFGADPNEFIAVPRENVKEAMEKSIFHPKSGSFYALGEAEYNNFISAVEEGVKEEDVGDFNFNKMKNEFVYKTQKVLDCKTTIGFSKNAVGICKKIECTLNEKKVDKLMDVFEDIYEKYDEMSMLIDEESFEESLKQYRNQSKDVESTVELYICYGRIVEINIETLNDDKLETTTVVFDYGINSCGYTLESKTEQEVGSRLLVKEHIVTYTKNEENGVMTIDIDEDTVSKVYKNDKEIDSNEKNSYQKFVWDISKGKYVYTVGMEGVKQQNITKGDLCLDKNGKRYAFTINEILSNGNQQTGDIITLRLSKCGDDSGSKNHMLFEMTEDEFSRFYRTSNLYHLEEYYDYDCTKYGESMYTIDQKPIYNEGKVRKNEKDYTRIFNSSMNNFYSVYTDRDLSTNYGYIYDEETELYFLMSYSKYGVDIKYSYSLTPELEEKYHVTTWSEDGGSINFHDLIQLETVEPDCYNEGKTVYQCKICNDKVAIYIDKLKHTKTSVEKMVLCADNIERKAIIEKCEICDLLYSVQIEEYCGVTLTKLSTGGYKCSLATYTSINNEYYFDIPESLAKELNIVEFDCSIRHGVVLCQLPYGINAFKADMLPTSLKTLIIPSTVKNVTKVSYMSIGGLKGLKYIYYCGSEEDWNNGTGFADFLKKCPNAKLVYCPEGFSPEMISD